MFPSFEHAEKWDRLMKQKVSGPESKTGDNMTTMTRREHMKGLLGLAASLSLPQQPRTAEEAPIPPQGIGRRIRHLSYTDLGGRPHSVQVMPNRRHAYVVRMFSNRLWWPGGRYAFVAAHFDGFTDHILCIVDLKNITKPEIVSRWWLPGMNRAAGETPTLSTGRRAALHHMLTAGNRGYGAWRDGGLTVHDISDPTKPTLLSHINWSPPFPGGTHTALPWPSRSLAD